MKKHNCMETKKDADRNITVSVDVTKIVKYSCVTSVFIVLIVFGSNILKNFFNQN